MSRPVMSVPGKRFRAYLRLGRISNLPTVWTNVLAGACLAGAIPSLGELAPIWLAISLFYLAGMFLNDAFDLEFDREFRPERPIPAGEVSRQEVMASGLIFLLAGAVIAVIWAERQRGAVIETAIAAMALIGAILYYNYFHKSISYGALVMALCRTLIYLMAAFIFTTGLQWQPVIGGVLLFIYMTGLTELARREHLQETTGAGAAVLLLTPLLMLAVDFSVENLSTAVLFLVWIIYSIAVFYRGRSEEKQRAVGHLLAAICLLDSIMMASANAPLGYVVFALAAFLVTLFLHRLVAGT